MLTERFDTALAFAVGVHRGQLRKGTPVPYAAHVLGVAAIVLEHGGTENEAIAALLHDAVEDQGGAPTLEAIRERFGAAVARIVESCSDCMGAPKPPWRERKEQYIAHLAQASASALLVSAADKLYNLRSVARDLRRGGDEVWGRFSGGREGSLWYYRAVTDAVAGRIPLQLQHELESALAEVSSLAHSAAAV
jgi:GTP pyrophosphokinase